MASLNTPLIAPWQHCFFRRNVAAVAKRWQHCVAVPAPANDVVEASSEIPTSMK